MGATAPSRRPMISERKHTRTAPCAIGRSKPAARAAAASLCSGFTSPKTCASVSTCALATRRSNRIDVPLEVFIAVARRDVPTRGILKKRLGRRAEAALEHEGSLPVWPKADCAQKLTGALGQPCGHDH